MIDRVFEAMAKLFSGKFSEKVKPQSPMVKDSTPVAVVNPPVPNVRQQILIRAMTIADGQARINYKLGKGGTDHKAVHPGQRTEEGLLCDCSGFVAWCCGVNRERKEYSTGWVYTKSMYYDAKKTHILFRVIDKPQPGDIVVFYGVNKPGHTGIYTGGGEAYDWKTDDRFWRQALFIDCSPGNSELDGQDDDIAARSWFNLRKVVRDRGLFAKFVGR